MFICRFGVFLPVLTITGSLCAKQRQPTATYGPLFIELLIGTALSVGALTFASALALGPVAEQLLFWLVN